MSPRRLAAVLAAAALALAGCGAFGDVRDFIEGRYTLVNRSGDIATFASPDPVGATAATIVGAENPAARQADGGAEYLRYDDDIVIVSAAGGGGSTVRVEDLDGSYSRGGFIFLGPGFNPGSPAGGSAGGGPGDVK